MTRPLDNASASGPIGGSPFPPSGGSRSPFDDPIVRLLGGQSRKADVMDMNEPTLDNLPFYDAPTVTLFKEQLVKFREGYGQLGEFCAFVLGVEPERMCNADFGVWLLKQDDETIARAPMWMREAAAFILAMRTAADDD